MVDVAVRYIRGRTEVLEVTAGPMGKPEKLLTSMSLENKRV